MPTVVTLLAIRAGLRDARTGEPAFLWGIICHSNRRRERILAAWKDITQIFIVALVVDTAYQLSVLRAFYIVQALIVAVACAIVPYVLIRGPATCLARALPGKRYGESHVLATDTSDGKKGHEVSQDRSEQ
jgi:hypothetical protein